MDKETDTKSIAIGTKKISISGLAMGILAVLAGILVLVFHDSVQWIVGTFLIVWGILAIIDKR